MNDPLISILIDNYNYGCYLRQSIDSGLSQTYSPKEIIVVDDGSTDDSRNILDSYGSDIVAVYKMNGGQASAFNVGFTYTRGDIICFLDSDDLFMPNKLDEIVNIYSCYPDIGWCYHALELFGDEMVSSHIKALEKRKYKMHDSKRYDLRKSMKQYRQRISPPPTSGLTYKRDLLSRILPLNEALKITADKYMKSASFYLAPGYYSKEKLAMQRIHNANHYTVVRDKRAIIAKTEIITAYSLRFKYNDLMKYSNNLLAKGLSRTPVDDKLRIVIKKYYAMISYHERLMIRLLKLLHTLRFRFMRFNG